MQKQDDQHEHTFSNYVRIRDVVQKTCLKRWTIGKSGERGSGISVLPARHDDIYIYIYIYISCHVMSCWQHNVPWFSLSLSLSLSWADLLDCKLQGLIPDRIHWNVHLVSSFELWPNFLVHCFYIWVYLLKALSHKTWVVFNVTTNLSHTYIRITAAYPDHACTSVSHLHIRGHVFDRKHLVVYRQLTSLNPYEIIYIYIYL